MGNNLSTTSNSALLFLDQQATRAGETVSGNVCVNVYDTNAQFNGLAIQVCVKEYALSLPTIVSACTPPETKYPLPVSHLAIGCSFGADELRERLIELKTGAHLCHLLLCQELSPYSSAGPASTLQGVGLS